MGEQWRDIPGFSGYQASNTGLIRSLDRTVIRSNGAPQPLKGKQFRLINSRRTGYLIVRLPGRTWGVHQLVMQAFVGPRPQGMEVRHLNGNRHDNRLENLKYGTRSENVRDSVAHGTNVNAAKTHCPQGHEYTEENTVIKPSEGRRRCRACLNASARRNQTNKRRANGVTPRGKQTHCVSGHPLSGENLYYYVTKRGEQRRVCRACDRQRARRYRARRRTGSASKAAA